MERILRSRNGCYLARVSILLIILASFTSMAGCNGNQSQNLEIRTWYDLDAVRNNLAGHHVLMNDLDVTTPGYVELASPTANRERKTWVWPIYDQEEGWDPIGTEHSPFTGTFEGQGYEIRDLFINRLDEEEVGLFRVVGGIGIIKNLGLTNASVTGYDSVGGIVAINLGTVTNCHSSGNMSGFCVGGLVARNNSGSVSHSYSAGNVTGNNTVGGLVGGNSGLVSHSYSAAAVTGERSVGGLVGSNWGTVANSYCSGAVAGNENIGGLIGENGEDRAVSNAFWDTQTTGQATSAGGTGKTTMEMQDIITFSSSGWKITAVVPNETNPAYIWNIVNNVTYPFLSWEAP